MSVLRVAIAASSIIFPDRAARKITAIMGPSGIGKTTLLRLIGGQIAPDHGEILFDGENIPAMSRSRLYTVRKRMSMLFQSGALFTDMNVFDNVAYPLREHTQLPAPLLHSTVMMKLEAVGLRGAAKLMPSGLSVGWRGVQRWRVRLRWSRISSCLMNLLLGKIPSPWAYW